MRIDRLLGITMYLLNRDIVTSNELSNQFEVSVRTIQRDIESLNLAGIPISSQTGNGGGYEILDTFKLNKQITNADDYLFIITALKGLCTAVDNNKINNTLEKLLMVGNNSVNQHIFLDFSVLKEKNETREYINVFDKCILEKSVVNFDYTNADNKAHNRNVEPLAVTYQWYSWYLFGYCTYKQDYRLFKFSRISNVDVINVKYNTTHEDVNLLLEKQLNNDTRPYYDIKLLCKKESVLQAKEYLNGNIIEEKENGDVLMTLHTPTNERMWFSLLLGFGNDILIIEPQELKDRVVNKAKEIIKLYESL